MWREESQTYTRQVIQFSVLLINQITMWFTASTQGALQNLHCSVSFYKLELDGQKEKKGNTLRTDRKAHVTGRANNS